MKLILEKIKKNQDIQIKGNLYLLGVLITVLLDNAKDHGFDGITIDQRRVVIQTEITKDLLRIVYYDNGNGFKSALVKMISSNSVKVVLEMKVED